MQLFILHTDPDIAARLLCDTHLTSQGKETAQILYTVLHNLKFPIDSFFIPGNKEKTHAWKPVWPHPCVDWAGSSLRAFAWTLRHGFCIADEFEERYGHKMEAYWHFSNIVAAIAAQPLSEHMPELQPGGFSWLNTLPERVQERIEPRLAFSNTPDGVNYGIVAMDPEFVVDSVDGFPDCVGSYRKFYAHKAKHKFVMKWKRTFDAPNEIQDAFRAHFPDTPPLAVRPSKSPNKSPSKSAIKKRVASGPATETTIDNVESYLRATKTVKRVQ